MLLLDEPLSNLDAHLRNEMRDLIFNLQRQLGITTIVVTHDQEEAVILADQIALLFNGILQQFGEPSDFYERPLTVPVARFFGQANFIPGHQWGAQVETSIGAFVTAQSNLPDGSVILAIRPEHIQLGDSANENQCCGHVVNCVYAGTHTRFTVQTSDTTLPPLHIIAHDTRHHLYAIGDPVTLTLPANKIWLLPPE